MQFRSNINDQKNSCSFNIHQQKLFNRNSQKKRSKFIPLSTHPNFYSTIKKIENSVAKQSIHQKDQKDQNNLTKFVNRMSLPKSSLKKQCMNETHYNQNNFRRYSNVKDEQTKNFLNKYELISELGRGTYGIVHKANLKQNRNKNNKIQLNFNKNIQIYQTLQQQQQKQQIKQVAIKIYEKYKFNKNLIKFQNIRKQIYIMNMLNHPNIIKLIQNVQTLTKISLVVQYGGNVSLFDYLKNNYPLKQKYIQSISKQLLQAINYLHLKNIVHRDLKLQNILIHNNYTIKLIDFGFSTLTYHNRKLNAICGTPNFMAPQLLHRQQYVGYQADIWSYGILVYIISEGKHPFQANNFKQLQKLTKIGKYEFKMIKNPLQKQFIRSILKIKGEERPKASKLLKHPWISHECS